MKHFICVKETDTDVWKFEAILKPIIHTPDVRTSSISYDLNQPRTIDVIPQNFGGANLAPTAHQGFQQVQHQCSTSASTSLTSKEFNIAPTIFAALMLTVATFHGWGAWQYYQGSISNKMECKR